MTVLTAARFHLRAGTPEDATGRSMTDLHDQGEDWSFEARMAADDVRRLAVWEERRAGRPIRLWEADIEAHSAAVDRGKAWTRLTG
jgi:hypothetical protein